ncbi:hypothetical protein SAMN05192583_3530 [Sphingomonas gellani]|uniref:Esterase n=1 Tax=Sphingomonas gellani TaxID=1166340 RepID=A0A1H8JAH1_9SPHN|nr:alpha/beta hydrolase [Sphingomonas gellani]SEN77108.1 hypothetical protein SAMN05192583_3530 [Sphingomonas gellani]
MDTFTSHLAGNPVVLTVPGLGGSGSAHWQTLWEQSRSDTVRADLGMWDRPKRNSWVTRLDEAIRRAQAPVVLAAHSLGCLAVAWWATLSPQPWGWPVAGALLVAPPDVDQPTVREELRGFAPSPRAILPFPSIVVASSDDPWATPLAARNLASSWGSHLIDVGSYGHLNAASGIGLWQEGQDLLERVLAAGYDRNGTSLTPSAARTVLANGLPASNAGAA